MVTVSHNEHEQIWEVVNGSGAPLGGAPTKAEAEQLALEIAADLAGEQPCRGCGQPFPYDPDAAFCPACAATNRGEVA
jgi:hypothetical protein